MGSSQSFIIIEDSTLVCMGTSPQTLAEVGMMGWQEGYDLARRNAPHFLTLAAQQETAEQACQKCFWQLSPLDANLLKDAYRLGWHMGYAAAMRGDSWICRSGQLAPDLEDRGIVVGIVSDDDSLHGPIGG